MTITDTPLNPTSTRPRSDPAVIARRPSRPDGVFVAPGKAAGTRARRRRRARVRRSERRHPQLGGRLIRALGELRLPPPAAHRMSPPTPTRLDSAAAIGEWTRRRDDPNP